MVLGCLDSLACNYDMDANTDDESCEFPGDACDDMDENTENDTLNIDCICVGDTIQDRTDLCLTSTVWSSACSRTQRQVR